MDIAITVMLDDTRNPDDEPLGWYRGDVVEVSRASADYVANPVNGCDVFFILVVRNVPGTRFRRLKDKLVEQDMTAGAFNARRKWRIPLPSIPAPIRTNLVNPPHIAVVGWEPFKSWTDRKADGAKIEDADL